ncbi:hypothetical protein RND81_10G155400 [Saponaria officinalis]|uniref:Uncharacterized protein n=1 Tax=Saponaria officinalis TaxID=3572 RepID=A0AAW1I4X0_SAPOF
MTIGDVLGQSKPVAVPTKSAIYVWGYNQRGLTGRTKKDRKFRIARQLPPELFGCLARSSTRWLDVARGREHTAAVASDGSLYLGFRSFPPAVLNPCVVSHVSCGFVHVVALSEEGVLQSWVSISGVFIDRRYFYLELGGKFDER